MTRTLLFSSGLFFPGQAVALDIYVSPTGNDAGAGTIGSPYATPQRARDAIRALKAGGPLSSSVDVIFRAGTYYLTETLLLEAIDSGTASAPITWRAALGEKVILSGGRQITGTWTTTNNILWQINIPETRGWVRNPAAAESYEQIPSGPWHFREMFVDTNRAIRARFPNKNAANPFMYATGGANDRLTLGAGIAKAAWNGEPDAQINIVINWRFFNQWNDVVSVNATTNTLMFGPREQNTTVKSGDWFWIEGVRSELDQAQEWYLDPVAGQLFYMPATGVNPNTLTIIAPYLNRIVYLKGDVNADTHVKYVYFKGLEFRHTTFTLGQIEPRVFSDAAVMFENAQSCQVDNCTFRNTGGYAFWMHLDCSDNRFNANLVTDVGGGGVLMTGASFSYMGPAQLYTPGVAASKVAPYLNYVTKNIVQHSGKIRYYGGGVHMDSRPANMTMMQGNRISHNIFEDLSRNGVFAFRNQGGNIVEFNRIHNALQATIDGAAIHFATMTHENAPNYIMNNYIYDIWGYSQRASGTPSRMLANGVYLDWATSNTTVRFNCIYNTAGGALKTLMSNQNINISNNDTSNTLITPTYINQVGPLGDTAINVNLDNNWFPYSSVIHYSDTAEVKYTGGWVPIVITGFWGLFTYRVLEAPSSSASAITFSIPIQATGPYLLSIIYPPSTSYASNAVVQVKNNNTVIATRTWDMQTGDAQGFSLPIGTYNFTQGATAQITISNTGANGTIVANSIAYVYKNPIVATTPSTLRPLSNSESLISIYDIRGKLVRRMISQVQTAKSARITWDGKDQYGNPLGTGTYVIRVKTGENILLRKTTVVR